MEESFDSEARKDAGTYLKVVRCFGTPSPLNQAFLVLYLRHRGTFLFAGYWPLVERSVVAGRWLRDGARIKLEGRGMVSTHTGYGLEGALFEREFTVDESHSTPFLTAFNVLQGWSLLSWPGQFTYVGCHTYIDPDGKWLPNSARVVDQWVASILEVSV